MRDIDFGLVFTLVVGVLNINTAMHLNAAILMLSYQFCRKSLATIDFAVTLKHNTEPLCGVIRTACLCR